MKKILFVCDGKNFSKASFNFIKLLNQTEKIVVAGVFYLSVDVRILFPTSLYPDPEPLSELIEREKDQVKETVRLFVNSCTASGIEYRLHEKGAAWSLNAVVKESRFSDVLVLSEELFFADWGLQQPNHFMREVLRNAECPVIIIPERFKGIDKVLIAYDGKAEAVLALKLFSMLFPGFSNLAATIFYVGKQDNENIPDVDLLSEYASGHYSNIRIEKLHIDSAKSLPQWIGGADNAIVVTGAYSRSALSTLFRESFIEKIIKEHCAPVFVAHH